MKAILFEDLKGLQPERTTEELLKIVDETNPDLILRSVTRGGPWTVTNFNKAKANVSAIKTRFPNILIIGNLFFQVIGKVETDDITGTQYSSDYVYNNLAFDPAKFGITSITKCEYQCFDDTICICKGPGEAQTRIRWIPDITIPEVQTLFIHQAEKLLQTGIDGIWIDELFFNVRFLEKNNASETNIQKCVDASIYVCTEIKKMSTLYGKMPLISTWYNKSNVPYYLNNIYWNDKFFDFLTIAAPNQLEIQSLTTTRDFDDMINTMKLYHNSAPLITYIDWGYKKHPLWYFSQWYPGYIDCCEATDSIINREKRTQHQKDVLITFTKIFNEKGIIWAYPVHGGGTCKGLDCTIEVDGPCCVRSYGSYHIYDSQAPEFQTYYIIVELMNQQPNILTFLVLISFVSILYYTIKK